MRRSMLFLPGNNPNMLINGNCLGADAVIFDLEDAVAPAKILKEYADKIKLDTFKLKGGFIDGEVIDSAKVEELAATPAKPVLVCKLMGSMMSPLYGLAYALQAVIDKSSEAPAEAAAEA